MASPGGNELTVEMNFECCMSSEFAMKMSQSYKSLIFILKQRNDFFVHASLLSNQISLILGLHINFTYSSIFPGWSWHHRSSRSSLIKVGLGMCTTTLVSNLPLTPWDCTASLRMGSFTSCCTWSPGGGDNATGWNKGDSKTLYTKRNLSPIYIYIYIHQYWDMIENGNICSSFLKYIQHDKG